MSVFHLSRATGRAARQERRRDYWTIDRRAERLLERNGDRAVTRESAGLYRVLPRRPLPHRSPPGFLVNVRASPWYCPCASWGRAWRLALPSERQSVRCVHVAAVREFLDRSYRLLASHSTHPGSAGVGGAL